MPSPELSTLTDEQLLAERKKMKSNAILHGVLIGMLIGIAVYSTVKNGFGFFTLFPLFFVFILFRNIKKEEAFKKELKNRDLK